ncbi:MAG: rhamnulokinase [Caldilineaceae bacterium]|nr:rhamnulokinase [Caldilineaceae bacterium]
MTTKNYLGFDFGAESGRAMVGAFNGEQLSLAEVHRFPNTPVRLPNALHWNTLQLWQEIQSGIERATRTLDGAPDSIGIDTWGVDFALLDQNGVLLGNPVHYRDDRTDGMMEAAFAKVPKAEIFGQTGIQFMQLNSLYQLLAMAQQQSTALYKAATFLTIPDLFNYWLTGRKVCEFTNATTTQAFNPLTGTWATNLLSALDIPTTIFPEIVKPGTVLGPLQRGVAGALGLQRAIPVVAPACHDTGSAVAAVPASNQRFGWISSGTWSIVGAEVPNAVVNEETLAYNLTNEGGVNDTYRLCKNVAGLWLVQECRRSWARSGTEHSYAELTAMAAEAMPFLAIIDPDHIDFLKPSEPGDDMPGRIQARCHATGQPTPENKGAIIRCALESLALKYRWVLEKLETILGYQLEPLHIVGGGTQNRLLCQLTADATGRQVIAGPVEATAIGNIIMQAVALGDLASLTEGRDLIRRSFDVVTYEPSGDRAAWDGAYARLVKILDA